MSVERLLENNRIWAAAKTKADPDFFPRLKRQQAPGYLWIGCADSRVPANEIVNLDPGELFVHRNVANLVIPSDLNCLSVLQYAIEVLGVRHVIVVGHYGCGGVRTAMDSHQFGLIDNWLRPIKDIYESHRTELDAIAEPERRVDALCELNVRAQVKSVIQTTIVQNAWHRGQELDVHGWIYGLGDGLARDLGVTACGPDCLSPVHRMAPPQGSRGPR
jgi:carbonic anhydrase